MRQSLNYTTVNIDNPNVSKLELDFDMKNIDLFTDLYFEGLED